MSVNNVIIIITAFIIVMSVNNVIIIIYQIHYINYFISNLYVTALLCTGSKVDELLNSEGKMRSVVMPTHSLQQVAQNTGNVQAEPLSLSL